MNTCYNTNLVPDVFTFNDDVKVESGSSNVESGAFENMVNLSYPNYVKITLFLYIFVLFFVINLLYFCGIKKEKENPEPTKRNPIPKVKIVIKQKFIESDFEDEEEGEEREKNDDKEKDPDWIPECELKNTFFIRHLYKEDAWMGIYNRKTRKIFMNDQQFSNPSEFAVKHIRHVVDSDELKRTTFKANGWKECQVLYKSNWIQMNKLLNNIE